MNCIDPDCPQCTPAKWLVQAGRIAPNGKITAVRRFSYKVEKSAAIEESKEIWLGEIPGSEIVQIEVIAK